MNDKKQQSQQAFDQQAATYDTAIQGKHARTLYPFMLEQIIQRYGTDLLDVGCGTGELMLQVLREDPEKQLTGIDYSHNMVQIAQHKLGKKARCLFADAQHLPFADASFDLIYCNDSFHHYPEPAAVLQEIARVLRPGGCFILGDCYQPFLGRCIMNLFMRFGKDGDVRIYSQAQITRLLGEVFHQLRWRQVNPKAFIVTGIK